MKIFLKWQWKGLNERVFILSERLTERIDNVPDGESGVWVKNHDYISAAEKLADYEDLEEQELLLRLPISVGSAIWDIDFGSPYRYEVTGFSYGNINEDDYEEELPTSELIVYYSNFNGSITGNFPISEIGKTVFLTQSEAEEKLRELEKSDV